MMTLTLDPVAADWTQEVGIEAMGFLDLIQEFPDVHHLRRHQEVMVLIVPLRLSAGGL